MKSYIKYLLAIVIATFVIFETLTLGILTAPKGVFHSWYNSMVQDKYRILEETNEPKIIIISGSSSAFGLNQTMLEEATGYKVANLGLHAGFGQLFNTEISKANINAGDIVLLGYEYNWIDGFDSLDQNLIMTGIDDDIEIYTKIPINKWPDFIGYLFKYADKKNETEIAEEVDGEYSRRAFDQDSAQMIVERSGTYDNDEELDISGFSLSEETIEYLQNFKEYVENSGATIYFISPPVAKDAIVCDYSYFDDLKTVEEETIGITYISTPSDYFFPNELMYDFCYHCNSEGEKKRTELLIKDLKSVL